MGLFDPEKAFGFWRVYPLKDVVFTPAYYGVYLQVRTNNWVREVRLRA